ncbi:hypothetical protein CYMTET_24625 [Cymbomonas tetramitiformis]|uniref:Protein kinase domain-containing protein n=1 Tax=Cymbomonas tetramitiformis TaxID=36881 RepID=A0AAE0FWW6_9CHLO|nr:hypothetical protein CYMTET_24625 [Cymbomonas tetramitiformis]
MPRSQGISWLIGSGNSIVGHFAVVSSLPFLIPPFSKSDHGNLSNILPTTERYNAVANVASLTNLLDDVREGRKVLRYEKTLGAGSYKEVWQVSIDGNQYALSTQRFSNANIKRRKIDAKNAEAELEMAQFLHTALGSFSDSLHQSQRPDPFEVVLFWWAQDHKLQPDAKGSLLPAIDTYQDIPSRSPKSTFVYVLKPLYEFDLRKFQNLQGVADEARRKSPTGVVRVQDSVADRVSEEIDVGAGRGWTDSDSVGSLKTDARSAVQLTGELLQIGDILQRVGVVHADIKPANIMILHGHAILIDFGYARHVDAHRRRGCESGLRGEPEYVLGSDARMRQTCPAGDVYAMAKSIYETLFVYQPPFREMVSFETSTIDELNWRLRTAMKDDRQKTRFRGLSPDAQEQILSVLRGMCRVERPYTFKEAYQIFNTYFPDWAVLSA